jgi:hypothetical protein
MYLHCCETYLVCSVYGVVIKWNMRNDKNQCLPDNSSDPMERNKTWPLENGDTYMLIQNEIQML